MNEKRLTIFIDGSNLFWGMEIFRKGFRVDLFKLIEELTQGRDILRTYYYASQRVPPVPKQTAFYDKLTYAGIQCTIKNLQYDKKGHTKEKGVDVALATSFLVAGFRDTFDVAIIVSGDQDLADAIKEVQGLGKRVEVAGFRLVMSDLMKRTADRVIFLDDIISKIALQ